MPDIEPRILSWRRLILLLLILAGIFYLFYRLDQASGPGLPESTVISQSDTPLPDGWRIESDQKTDLFLVLVNPDLEARIAVSVSRDVPREMIAEFINGL